MPWDQCKELYRSCPKFKESWDFATQVSESTRKVDWRDQEVTSDEFIGVFVRTSGSCVFVSAISAPGFGIPRFGFSVDAYTDLRHIRGRRWLHTRFSGQA